MPGICGIVAASPIDGDVGCAIESMQQGLIQASWHVARAKIVAPARCALGAVYLDHHRHSRLYIDEHTADAIVFDGELFGADSQSRFGQSGTVAAGDAAATLLHGYQEQGRTFLSSLRGSFAAALWIAAEQRLMLITDRLATRPLYYSHSSRGLRFASSIASLIAADDGQQQVNPRGLAQFFTFGHYLRDDTSLEGVRVLPAAACFEFDAQGGSLSRSTYWSLSSNHVELPKSEAALLDQIDERFQAAVDRCTDGAPDLGISLSGGLDARAILGVMNAQETPLSAVCMGVKGSLDHRSSAELARIAGCPFHEYVLDGAFLGRFGQHLERMVALTDGQYLSQCIVIPTLDFYRSLGIRTLLRGHGGELMHMRKAYSYSLDDEALAIRTGEQLRGWLSRRLQAYMLDGVTTPLFRPAFQNGLQSLAAESLNEDLADVESVADPLDRIWHLFVKQRLRRETVLSMLKFRSYVEPRLPYFDEDLVSLLLAAPTSLKLGEEIQTHILRKRRPAYLKVLNANTGAPMGSSAWRQRLSTFQLKVYSKLGLPGYQPYERLGLWLRRDVASQVRDILLSPQTLENGVYSPDGIRAVVRGHLEEGKNHTYLLMALMIFELGLRTLNAPGKGLKESSVSSNASMVGAV